MLQSGDSCRMHGVAIVVPVCAGAPVSYKLVPAPSPPLYALPSSSHARRGIFATRNLWVTPHSDDENYPAGFHPLQAHGADGLEQWTNLVGASAFANFPSLHLPSSSLHPDAMTSGPHLTMWHI